MMRGDCWPSTHTAQATRASAPLPAEQEPTDTPTEEDA